MNVFVPKGSGSIKEMQKWLREQKIVHEPVSRILENKPGIHGLIFVGHEFIFANDADAMAFKLRWL